MKENDIVSQMSNFLTFTNTIHYEWLVDQPGFIDIKSTILKLRNLAIQKQELIIEKIHNYPEQKLYFINFRLRQETFYFQNASLSILTRHIHTKLDGQF